MFRKFQAETTLTALSNNTGEICRYPYPGSLKNPFPRAYVNAPELKKAVKNTLNLRIQYGFHGLFIKFYIAVIAVLRREASCLRFDYSINNGF